MGVAKMSLHDPNNLKLPALKIEKKEDRKLIENDDAVKNLINSKLLLNRHLNQLLVEFLGSTKEINRFLETKDEYKRLSVHFGDRTSFRHYRMLEWQLVRKLKKGTKAQKQELETELNKLVFQNNLF